MDAKCNACGGRVMSYTRYAAHFRPTATCGACGAWVRMRHYGWVVAAALTSVAVLAAVVLLTHSRSWALTALALGTLLGFLADFWTFRNLSWDLDGGEAPSDPSA